MVTENNKVKSFSETLSQLLRQRGVSSKVVSQATGIPTSTLSEWTSGRLPKVGEDVLKLAKFFGVSLEYLITGKEPEQAILEQLSQSKTIDFLNVHNGIYRITVERCSESYQNKRKGD